MNKLIQIDTNEHILEADVTLTFEMIEDFYGNQYPEFCFFDTHSIKLFDGDLNQTNVEPEDFIKYEDLIMNEILRNIDNWTEEYYDAILDNQYNRDEY